MAQRISVIVPAYNNAPWLGRCLDSLLAQTYENLEIVVVNDGSRDDTAAVLDSYAARYEQIKAIHQENGGVTAARLHGISQATGDWLGFVDGDDEVEPQMYERLLENAVRFDADISHCGQQVVFPDGRTTVIRDDGFLRQQDHLTGLRDLLDGGLIESGLCTKLYQKELFAGLEDWMDRSVRHNEDLLMNFYLFRNAKKSVFEAVCPYHYILRQGSASYQRAPALSLIEDQIHVRQVILQESSQALEADARQALLRNALFLYSWLAVYPQREYDRSRALVRGILKENKANFPVLSRRNRLLAQMICTAPWAFTLAFRTYQALFRREEQH